MHASTIEKDIRLACRLEATARKPGNVHPRARFSDLSYENLMDAAGVVAPVLARAGELGVGRAIFTAVEATRGRCPSNANLGIVLLLAPLAAAATCGRDLAATIGGVLARLTREDAAWAFRAVRLAEPGGMGRVDRHDVALPPTITLLEAMRLAADRDGVAAQYANDFELVLGPALDLLADGDEFLGRWEEAVVRLHLWLMATLPDTLIARKCGFDTARQSARLARGVLDAGWPHSAESQKLFSRLDGWLRADGNRRNPGTTADLVAACLFAGFHQGRLERPHLEPSDVNDHSGSERR